jgi:N-acetylmuramic acid 6-phosphate etherase
MSAVEIVRLMNEEEAIVLRAMKAAESAIAIAAERVAETFRFGGRIVYVGAGTSGRIASADAAEMQPTFSIEPGRFITLIAGGPHAASESVEGAEDEEYEAIASINRLDLERKDAVIGISASGRTPYVVAAVKHAAAKGVWTCGIANVKGTPLLDLAHHAIVLETGPEVLTGSTRLKAGTAQKMALNRISTIAMVLCGKVIENLMIDVHPKNQKLKERCVNIVRELTSATQAEARDLLESHGYNIRSVLALLHGREKPRADAQSAVNRLS